MFREEMRVLGLPGAEDVTDGSVDYYDMDWENVENGVTEELKASDQMKWVGLMNNIRAAAEEVALTELVYADT